MLNENQIKIADFLLKYLDSAGGKSSLDDYPAKLRKQGFDDFDSHSLVKLLIEHLSLIDYVGKTDYWIMLTPEGQKAAKMGISEYFNELETDKILYREEKRASITGVKNARKLSVIAIALSVIIPVLIQIPAYKVNGPANVNQDGSTRQNISNADIPLNFTDSIHLEKIKNALKHDTLFLNDVKLLIDK